MAILVILTAYPISTSSTILEVLVAWETTPPIAALMASLTTTAASGVDLKGRVINHGLIPEPSISSSNSTIDQWCFVAMKRLGIKKKRYKVQVRRWWKANKDKTVAKKLKKQEQMNSRHVQIDGADLDVLERLWKKRRKL